MTQGLRASAVDVNPIDGRLLVVVEGEGTNALVLLTSDGEIVAPLVAADPEVHWGPPRWSPDGTRVAVTRWRTGGVWDVVILDPEGGVPLAELDADRASKDGVVFSAEGGWLLWSSERSGTSNLYGVPLDDQGMPSGPLRQFTDAITAARSPVVISGEGALVYASLSGSGWDLVRVPFSPEGGFDPLPRDPRFDLSHDLSHDLRHGLGHGLGSSDGARGLPEVGGESLPYRGFRDLRPRYVLPVEWSVPEAVGAVSLLPRTVSFETGATDPLDRVTWSARIGVPMGGADPRWGGALSASLRGGGLPSILSGPPLALRSTVQLRLDQQWVLLGAVAPPGGGSTDSASEGASSGAPDLLYVVGRERRIALGGTLLSPGFHSVSLLTGTVGVIDDHRELLEATGDPTTRARLLRPNRRVLEGVLGSRRTSARQTAWAPGTERGVDLQLQLRARREVGLEPEQRGVSTQDASFRELFGGVRTWIPLSRRGLEAAGGAPPILALRGGAGAGWGPGSTSVLSIGGGGGGGAGVLGATWNHPSAPFAVRGFDRGVGRGNRAVAGTAEVRFPLVVLHRGGGTRPFYLDRMAGALFVDGAEAWVAEASGEEGALGRQGAPGTRGGTLASAGVEIVAIHSLLTRTPVHLRAGWVRPFRGGVLTPTSGGASVPALLPRPSVYAAVGWSF